MDRDDSCATRRAVTMEGVNHEPANGVERWVTSAIGHSTCRSATRGPRRHRTRLQMRVALTSPVDSALHQLGRRPMLILARAKEDSEGSPGRRGTAHATHVAHRAYAKGTSTSRWVSRRAGARRSVLLRDAVLAHGAREHVTDHLRTVIGRVDVVDLDVVGDVPFEGWADVDEHAPGTGHVPGACVLGNR